MNPKKIIRKQLEKLADHKYQKKLKSYQTEYEDWLKEIRAETSKKEKTSHAQSKIQQDFVLLPSGEGEWDEKIWCEKAVTYLEEHPKVLLLYGDEDVKMPDGRYTSPWFKPDWSPDTYLCRDYLGGAVAARRELYDRLSEEEKREPALAHKKLVEFAGGFSKGCDTIGHIQEICFHRNAAPALPGESSTESSLLAECAKKKSTESLVSVIIPSKDNASVLKQCLRTLCTTVVSVPYEIIIVDNGSCKQVREQIRAEIEEWNADYAKEPLFCGARYLYEEMPFNFSKMCNMGAEAAKGNLLLFLNDDIEATENGWQEAMTEKAMQPWTGAVGIKLYYPDSDRIQHAGITNIEIGPVHKLQFSHDNKYSYDSRNRGIWNVLAVTGACLMVRKAVFEEAGGFSEALQVAFNDVDLCFTLYEKGYHNVVLNDRHLLHHESLSRGADESEEKLKRLIRERELLYRRHPKLEGYDPYYHPWLNSNALDTKIRPVYEEGRQIDDEQKGQPGSIPKAAAQNDCLLLRIEYADTKRIQGYAIVLGSNNAVFEKTLVLKPAKEGMQTLLVPFKEQYRPDLQENMPDQKNIALCGFHIHPVEALPAGEYRIGVVAKDTLSGMTLFQYSNRTLMF